MPKIWGYIQFALLFLISGCFSQPDLPIVTPPIVAAATETAVPSPTQVPPTAVAETSTPVPTETILPPTPTPIPTATPTPTATPIPETAVDSITLEQIISEGLEKPVDLTHAFDERLFVVEQPGRIRIIQNGELLEEPFLAIEAWVDSVEIEQGFLGLVFHPEYVGNGRFFIHYTNLDGDVHISSFTVSADNPNLADPDSEMILLVVPQPFANHNGGQIKFGPDGYLYVALGDGGSANDPEDNAQNPDNLLGTILRLDVDHSPDSYAIPASNPFVTDDMRRNEIWAWGLRHPWRFSFDPITGNLFIADVGQADWEEVHFQPADSLGGENYGWDILEGSHCFQDEAESCDKTGLEDPIFEYNHDDGCSITGGYIYRGEQFLSLYGNYFVGDFCQGTIWRLFEEADGSWSSAEVFSSELEISSFGEDFQGELYVLGHAEGSVWGIRP